MERASRGAVLPSRETTLVYAGLFAIVAWRFAFVGWPAVWIDEAFSLYHARHTLAFLWGAGWQLETNPPLYYTVLWAWSAAFGGAESTARVLSVLLFVGATVCVHRGGTALGGRTAGLAAAWLFACHPLMFEYSLEIRPYALLQLLVAFTVAALVRLLAALERGDAPPRSAALRSVACVVAGCILVAYTHAIGPVIIASISSAAGLYGAMRPQRRAYWRAWAAANVIVFVGIVPQILSTLEVLATNRHGLAWYPDPTDTLWLYVFVRGLFSGLYTYGVTTTKLLALVMLAVVAWSAWRMRRRLDVVAVGVLMPVIGMALLFSLSLVQSILLPRTALWLVVPTTLLAGSALAGIDWHSAWSRLSAAMLTALALHMCKADLDGRAHWRPWAALVAQHAEAYRAGDIVVATDPETLCVLDFYAPDALRSAPRRILERGSAQHFRSGQRIGLGCNEAPRVGVDAIARTLADGNAVWLMGWDELQRRDVDAVVTALGARARPTGRIDMHGEPIAVRLAPP